MTKKFRTLAKLHLVENKGERRKKEQGIFAYSDDGPRSPYLLTLDMITWPHGREQKSFSIFSKSPSKWELPELCNA